MTTSLFSERASIIFSLLSDVPGFALLSNKLIRGAMHHQQKSRLQTNNHASLSLMKYLYQIYMIVMKSNRRKN